MSRSMSSVEEAQLNDPEWVDVDEPAYLADAPKIMEAFMDTFPEAVPVAEPVKFRPSRSDMIKVKGGGDYLGVRMRLLWMRADHPDWSTSTRIEILDWEQGLAVVEGFVRDESGFLIASDFKTETRRDFPDFLEKACTGALGRALAGAGYGTEGALELDEGIGRNGEPRIADAPVKVSITPSAVSGIKQGGRSEFVTTAQIKEIARLTKEAGLTPEEVVQTLQDLGLAPDDALDMKNWPLDAEGQNRAIVAIVRKLTFEQAGIVVQGLMKAVA